MPDIGIAPLMRNYVRYADKPPPAGAGVVSGAAYGVRHNHSPARRPHDVGWLIAAGGVPLRSESGRSTVLEGEVGMNVDERRSRRSHDHPTLR